MTSQPVQDVHATFDRALVSGNVKKAMSAVGASSRDLWQVAVQSLRLIPGFNVRVKDAQYQAHVRGLADSILANGFYQDKPLGGYVAIEGGEQVVYVYDGHCRFEAVGIAIQEGALIEKLPVVVAPAGTSLEDLTVALVQANAGKPLSPFEVAVVVKRLVGYGWDSAQVAGRVGITETYVEALLQVMAAPLAIREMIQDGRVAVNTALEALRRYGSEAVAKLQAAEDSARASGKTKVTAKHLPGKRFESLVKRSGPKLYDAAMTVTRDPAFAKLRPETREALQALLDELDKAKATDDDPASSEAT